MATLTLTIPDQAIPRIREAFRKLDPETGKTIPMTTQEFEQYLLNIIRVQVINSEINKAVEELTASMRTNFNSERW